jgi:hypothetical protein
VIVNKLCESPNHRAVKQGPVYEEVGKVYGKSLYILVNWDDPETAAYERARVISVLGDMYRMAYGLDAPDMEGKNE